MLGATGPQGGLMTSMSKLSLNQTNNFEKSRDQLMLNTNSNLALNSTLGNGALNFYTAQIHKHDNVSPTTGDPDLSASFVGSFGGGTSGAYQRRDTNLNI
jgi:hypothetical protein